MGEQSALKQYQDTFQTIASAVQHLPEDQRREISTQLGDFTHDIKHLLGLVTGANAVLLRSAPSDVKGARIVEMVGISDEAALKLNTYIDVLVKQLCENILID